MTNTRPNRVRLFPGNMTESQDIAQNIYSNADMQHTDKAKFIMFAIQSKFPRHSKRQDYMNHSEETN